MNATYKDLLDCLNEHPEKLNDNISIKYGDEFYEAAIKIASHFEDVLDAGHIFLEII